MVLVKWEALPDAMKNDSVRRYYDILAGKKWSLFWKRVFDVMAALLLLLIFCPLFLLLALVIKCDSRGPVFFRQERVTGCGRRFRIFKFRTMVCDAETKGTQLTTDNDSRITSVGRVLRRFHLDETAQLLNVLGGSMSFVGTRPEVPRYAEQYSEEMRATLLMPAGITSLASILYREESSLMKTADSAEDVYLEKILPLKMKYNLYALEHFSLGFEWKTMLHTVKAVLCKNYSAQKAFAAELPADEDAAGEAVS